MDQIEALRAAAGALTATAALPTIIVSAPPAARRRGNATIGARCGEIGGIPCGPCPPDATWAALRRRVRAAKAERGIGNAELATAIGAAKTTVVKALSANRSPTKAMRAKLERWLAEPAQAPEVITTATTFRPNGHHATYVGAANGAGAGTTADV